MGARSTREFFDPVEVLARKLGCEFSAALGEAAASDVREWNDGFAEMMDQAGLVATRLPPPPTVAKVAKEARKHVKWAADRIGDQKAFDRFSAELGEVRCPMCSEWCINPPCGTCRGQARDAARVPRTRCSRRIDPTRDGLCRKCRQAAR